MTDFILPASETRSSFPDVVDPFSNSLFINDSDSDLTFYKLTKSLMRSQTSFLELFNQTDKEFEAAETARHNYDFERYVNSFNYDLTDYTPVEIDDDFPFGIVKKKLELSYVTDILKISMLLTNYNNYDPFDVIITYESMLSDLLDKTNTLSTDYSPFEFGPLPFNIDDEVAPFE